MSRLTALVLVLSACPPIAAQDDAPAGVKEIVEELRKKNADPGGRPLPVASHWANGYRLQHFASAHQLRQLEEGRHVMPTLPMPRPGQADYAEEGKALLRKLARWNAPVTFRAGQWEALLMSKDHPRDEPGKWRALSREKTALAIRPDGTVSKWISPWGAVEPWREVGRYTTACGAFAQLQEIYPAPPFVILLSNNESRRLKPKHKIGEIERRAKEAVGPDGSLRKAMADGYVERYRALLEGVREGLTSETWRKNSKRVAYNAFGPPHFGRMGHWTVYSLATKERIDPWHLAWDGGSPSYYVHNWNASTDYRVHSPQVEAMNWVFMLEEAHRERPEFWFEMSVWDGNTADPKKCKVNEYLKRGQIWSPARYGGFTQFGMWLLRPRVVREFRGSTTPWEKYREDYAALVAAVDRVWTDPVLRKFWRHGRLVPNRARKHPYQANIPEKYAGVDRWFLLNTSADPPGDWKLSTGIPVFSLALTLGEKGAREWLVYAHSPLRERKGVEIEIPGYRKVAADVAVGGTFLHVRETDGAADPVGDRP